MDFCRARKILFLFVSILIFLPLSAYAQNILTPATFSGSVNVEGSVLASDGSISDYFGWSVSQYSNLLLVGAPLNDLNVANNDNAGAAYIYENIGGQWIQTAKLMASDAHEDAHFGGAVSLHGNKALIGSSSNNSHGQFSGTVYVFELQSGQWVGNGKVISIGCGIK